MSSVKRKQEKPTKSLHIKETEGSSPPKSGGPKTRNQVRSSHRQKLSQTRKSQRVPKKKVMFSNEIPVPRKRAKKKEDNNPLLSPGPSSSRIGRPQTPLRKIAPKCPPPDNRKQSILQVADYPPKIEGTLAEDHALSDSESDTEIKIETDSNLESVRIALKDTLESLQTMSDPTINVEIPYFVIKKKKKHKKAKKKRKKSDKEKGKKMKTVPEKSPTGVKLKTEKIDPVIELHDANIKENVLDIDQLRKLSAESLVVKYARHETVTVPKDKNNTITQSVYTCRMLPSHCFEKFMGIDEDTKQQITRHLLRHVGELLTMANEGMATMEPAEADANDEEDEAAAFVTSASNKTTYHVASNPKPFTVSRPQNVNLKRSRYTVIRSSEGKEGTNEVVLLPRGRGFHSYRRPGEEPQLEGITEQTFQSVIDTLLGQASKERVDGVEVSVVDNSQPPSQVAAVDNSGTGQSSGESAVIVGDVVNGMATVSGIPTSVVILDEKDIQMDVEVSTGVRRRQSSMAFIPYGVSSMMKMNHTLSDDQGGKFHDPENPQDVPYPDHNYSHADGMTHPVVSIQTDSQGATTATPVCIEESGETKLDIAPILHAMNQQVSSLIPSIEHSTDIMATIKQEPVSQQQQQPVSVSLADGEDPVAAAIRAAGVTSPDPVAAAILAAGVTCPESGMDAESSMGSGSMEVSSGNPVANGLASVMSPEEEEMLRLKAVDLLNSLLKNQKRRGPFRCQICQKILTAASTLRAHYRSHAGIKPFQCMLCNATFTRQHSLNYHMMIHNQEARFSCSFCARQFRHANHFREHLRRHTGEEPYGCTDCPARFKTRNTYKRHMRSKHNKIVTHKNTIKLITDESE